MANKTLLWVFVTMAICVVSATLMNPIQTDKQEYYLEEDIVITLNNIQGDIFEIITPNNKYQLIGSPGETIHFTAQETGIHTITVKGINIEQSKIVHVLPSNFNTSENSTNNTAIPANNIEIDKPIQWRIQIIDKDAKYDIPTQATQIQILDKNKKKIGDAQDIMIDNDYELKIHTQEKIQTKKKVFLTQNIKSQAEQISYTTAGPTKQERQITKNKKEVIISSPFHLKDVLTYTNIPETKKELIQVYWQQEDNKIIKFNGITHVDTNNDGNIDRLEWLTPHLSNQTFIIELNILDVQSYPVVGGEWNVRFTTQGTADLWIETILDTTWDNKKETEDLKFIELYCGDTKIQHEWINNKVFVQNFSCESVAYEKSKVLTTGSHHLKFTFGDEVGYANNWAYGDADVQRNSISSSGSTLTADINLVDTSTAFILFTASTGDDTPDDSQFTPSFINSSRISFTRYDGATTSSSLTWQVAQSNDAYVQHGEKTLSSGTASTTADFNIVNLSKSFIIVHGRCADETDSDSQAGFFTAKFVNETRLSLVRGNAGKCAATASWQVIQWEGASIQNGSATIGDNQASTNATISPVNMTETFIVFGNANIGTDSGVDTNMIRASLTNATNIHFEHEPTTTLPNSQRDIYWFAVSIPFANVQRNTLTFGGGTTTTTITGVNLTRSILLTSAYSTQTREKYSDIQHTAALTAADTITWIKQNNRQIVGASWQVVEFPGAIPDNIYPYFSNLSTSPNNQQYLPNALYEFNATINLTNGTVGLQFNANNNTPTPVSSHYTLNLSDLPVGSYTYKWWAFGNGRDNNYNETSPYTYNVTRAQSTTYTYLDNIRNNITIERLQSIDLNATVDNTQGTLKLYNNEILINEGYTHLHNYTLFNETGMFNITAQYAQTQNYSASYETFWVTVQDTTDPVLSNIKNNTITDTSSIITWDTDEATNSSVEYGETLALGTLETNPSNVLTHAITLTPLNANTFYYYQVTSCDPSGNCVTSNIYNFTTLSGPDLISPYIYNVTASNIQETSAQIYWNNSEQANGSIEYGTTPSLGTFAIETLFNIEQLVTISALDPLQLYYYNVTACDASNNCNTTGTYSFKTIDSSPPQWYNNKSFPQSGVQYTSGAKYQFNVTWTDNVAINFSTIIFEHNFSGFWVNDTLTGRLINETFFNFSDIEAGTYTWRVYANDTSNNTGKTDNFTFIVYPRTSVLNIYLNGTADNMSINTTEFVNISAILTTPSSQNVTIYIDGEQSETGQSPLELIKQFNDKGIFNITARYEGNHNYTQTQTTLWLTVNQPPILYPTNVIAENGKATLSNTQTSLNVDLQNAYDFSHTFMRISHISYNTGNSIPDSSTPTARFVNNSRIILERYATNGHAAGISYSILQSDNIKVWNWTKSWSSGEESSSVTLNSNMPDDYETKCFVETHRNMRLNSTDGNHFVEHEVRTTLTDTTTVSLIRDTEGTNTAAPGVQYGFVVCFLDNTTIQSGTFSISGDSNSESSIAISSITINKSFSVIDWYQNDDGIGVNNLFGNLSTTSNLIIHRDEQGGGQSALGRYYVIDFEDDGQANVQHTDYQADGTGTALTYETAITAVNQSRTLLSCEDTVYGGGDISHTKGYWLFTINSSSNGLDFEEGRDRKNTQDSDISCQVIEWPLYTSYEKPRYDLVVNSTSISYTSLIEGANSSLDITIYNDGTKDMNDTKINISINDIQIDSRVINITGEESTTYTIYHIFASIGEYNFSIAGDINESYIELDETNNEYNTTLIVSAYHTYYGETTNVLKVIGKDLNIKHNFGQYDADGYIYATDIDSNVDFSSLRGLGIRQDGTWALNDFAELDTALSMTNAPDSINTTWLKNGYSKNQTDLLLYGYNVVNVSIINSTISENFFTGIVYDYSDDTGTEFNAEEDVVFFSKINQDSLGGFGITDYEIKVPAKLGTYKGADDTIAFYYELE